MSHATDVQHTDYGAFKRMTFRLIALVSAWQERGDMIGARALPRRLCGRSHILARSDGHFMLV